MKPEKESLPNRVISVVTPILITLIATGSFALSYSNLKETALTYGIPAHLAWIWPLLVDFALVVFSLAVVRTGLYGDRTLWSWLMVAIYTVTTIVFNVLHAPDNLTAQVVAVVAPVTLFLSFETLMAMLKSGVRRNSLNRSLPALEAEMASKQREMAILEQETVKRMEEAAAKRQAEIDNLLSQAANELEEKRQQLTEVEANLVDQKGQLQEELETLERTIQSYQQDIESKQEELKRLDQGQVKVYLPGQLTIEQRQELVKRMEQDRLTQQQMAELLSVSLGTIKNDKKAISLNGHGG